MAIVPTFFSISRSTDTCVRKRLKVKVDVVTQLRFSSKSNKVQVLKCTQSIKVKNIPLKDISTSHFCAKLTELHVILESVGFVKTVPKRTRKLVDC